ncbi:MAG: response regulator transcription factor [Elusimicrobia bacterium]|nr:response regulator transcription factor [Elusimicrobiota bacterium]
MQYSILIIDDEPEIRRFLSKVFQKQNHLSFEAETGEAGIKLAQARLPSLITLDVNLPQMSGIEVCQALKRDPKTCSIPILIITGNDKEGQEVISLELGADDYLVKPLEIPMLLAHVHALLRRGPYLGTSPKVVEKDDLRLDLEKKLVEFSGNEFSNLTPKEFDLLYTLVSNDSKPIKREILYQKIWGTAPVSRSVLRTVDVHIQRIRSKLNMDRKMGILAVSGRGYMWSAAPKPS